jgi:uncharacterized membrane protein
MVNLKRWLIHAFLPPWRWRLAFPARLLNKIESAIQQSELGHRGELRFAVENTLTLGSVWRGVSARQRAIEIFSQLNVWDTEENTGVLIYIMLADKEVHIIADRGIAKQVVQLQWNGIAKAMESAFLAKDFEKGSMVGIEQISQLLAKHFPANAHNPNELSNRPVIIKH